MHRKKTSASLIKTIKLLQKLGKKSRLWLDIAERLKKPRRLIAEVNLSKLTRYTLENDVVVVPGKVLGAGRINHKLTVAALNFSKTARLKLIKAGCVCLSIRELAELNPKGSRVKIIG